MKTKKVPDGCHLLFNFIQGKLCLNNPHFQVEAQTVREQEPRYSQRHSDGATRLSLIDL